MNALLLSLVLSCGPEAQTAGGSCACGQHGQPAAVTAPAAATAVAAKPTEEAGSCHHGAEQAQGPKTAPGPIVRGEKLKGASGVTLTALLSKPAAFDGKTVALEGKVRRACTAMGCWMELAAADQGPGVRVTFKDGGFAVPLDSAGSTAKVEGQVKLALLSPERAKHYESEGALVAKGQDGKYTEVQLVATGVELRR